MHRTAGASAAGNWVNCCQNRGSLPPILLGNPAPAKSGNPPLIGPAVGFSLWGNCCCWYSQFAATWCSRVYCRNGLEHCVVEPRVNHFPAVAWTELQKLNSYLNQCATDITRLERKPGIKFSLSNLRALQCHVGNWNGLVHKVAV